MKLLTCSKLTFDKRCEEWSRDTVRLAGSAIPLRLVRLKRVLLVALLHHKSSRW